MQIERKIMGSDNVQSIDDASGQINFNAGHRERLKQRFEMVGEPGLCDHEILELLLMYSIPRRDVKPLSKQLLQTFGSLRSVIFAGTDSLTRVPGIGRNTALLIELVGTLGIRCLREDMRELPVLNNMNSLESYLRMKIGFGDYEKLIVLFLDRRGFLQSEWCSKGGSSMVELNTVELSRKMALSKNISAAVIAHNHPSGILSPSRNDLLATEKICNLMSDFGIKLRDHLIITEECCVSISDFCM